nr:hypothetical protein [Tanacetum cinerariifolium]
MGLLGRGLWYYSGKLQVHCRGVGRKWCFWRENELKGTVWVVRGLGNGQIWSSGFGIVDTHEHVPSQQELDLLFGPLYDEFFNEGSNPQDKQPTTNIQTTSTPSTPTNVQAEENNDYQAEEGEQLQDDEFTNPFCAPVQEEDESSDEFFNAEEGEQLQDDEFTNPFCAPVQEEAESSSNNVGNSNVPNFIQPQLSEYQWMKNHPLEQVRGNPSRPVQTRRQLAIDSEMYGFVDPDHPKKVYRLKKALYGLKQAPRVWYDELSKFLLSKGFTKGLQIHQSPRGIFINQAKYTLEILHKHCMDKGQSIGTPMATKPKLDAYLSGNPVDQTDYRSKIRIFRYLRGTVYMGLWYPKDSSFELTAFSDADHAGGIDTRKSTYGGIQFLGDKLVSWMSKKQNCTAMSSAEAKYVALFASCAQVMWMQTQLQDYGVNYNKISLYCDSQSSIAISCNPIQYSRTKHIHTRYHFIKEQVENGIIELYFVRTEYQLADMFTKALPEDRFKYLVRRIGMRCLTPAELESLAKESA